ncbi:MAG: hypothetical protein J5644_07255 [Bacteroidales bacterium]|nr:hypothetical protein [Bacteroidales bacterium]
MRDRDLNFILVCKAFEKEGWVMHHLFLGGNKWQKGNDKVTCYYGHFKLNGTFVSNEFICEMLHIDRRIIDVSEAIAPHSIDSKYGKAFLEGVRWADAHPANREEK